VSRFVKVSPNREKTDEKAPRSIAREADYESIFLRQGALSGLLPASRARCRRPSFVKRNAFGDRGSAMEWEAIGSLVDAASVEVISPAAASVTVALATVYSSTEVPFGHGFARRLVILRLATRAIPTGSAFSSSIPIRPDFCR
jgi:hypothetical protein